MIIYWITKTEKLQILSIDGGKNEHLSLDPHTVPSPSDVMQQHEWKDVFEIFELFLTPDIVELITDNKNLYVTTETRMGQTSM